MYDKEEIFDLTSSETGITETDGQGALWADIWDFTVPVNHAIVLKPTDVFGCKLVGDDAAEMPAKTQVRVLRGDVTNTERRPVLTPLPYQLVKEFVDKKKIMRLSITQPVKVGANEHIVVQVNGADAAGAGDTDASASYFKLRTMRIRKAL